MVTVNRTILVWVYSLKSRPNTLETRMSIDNKPKVPNVQEPKIEKSKAFKLSN